MFLLQFPTLGRVCINSVLGITVRVSGTKTQPRVIIVAYHSCYVETNKDISTDAMLIYSAISNAL